MIRYLIADPTGNLTALVESPVEPALRRDIAAAVMAAEPEAEQLGFLSPGMDGAHISLSMAGGEFCGNACLSAAAWYLRSRGEIEGRVSVLVSGYGSPLWVSLRKTEENEYFGTVDMPLPLDVGKVESPLGQLPIVRFPGISHVIAPPGLTRAQAKAMIVPLCNGLNAEALGLMLTDESGNTMAPLVYVPAAGSLFWERSCASGTAALGAYICLRDKRDLSISLRQPGGSLSISASCSEGELTRLSLGGRVKLLPVKSLDI